MNAGIGKPILIVEDFEPDARLLESVLTRAGVANPIHMVGDSDDAIAYLRSDGRYHDRSSFPLPGVLLLDIGLPGKNGLAVLECCKGITPVRDLLKIAITANNSLEVINQAYALGAQAFLLKPVAARDIVDLVSAFPGCWTNRPAV